MTSAILTSLAEHAQTRPDAGAVRKLMHHGAARDDPATVLTFAQWAGASGRLAQQLRQTLREDDTLAVGTGNRPEFYVALIAALLADRDVLPLSPDVGRWEVERVTRHVRCAAAIGTPSFIEHFDESATLRWASDSVVSEGEPSDFDAAADHCTGVGALLLNGLDLSATPRLLRRTMRALDAVAHNCAHTIGLSPEDRVLLSMPVHHAYGLEHGLLAPLVAGCAVEIADEFNAELVRRRLIEAPITVLPGVPFIFEALGYGFERSEPRAAPRALRRAYSAGAPLPRTVYDTATQYLGVPIGQVYGTSELGSVTFNDPNATAFAPESVGAPMPGVNIHVLDREAPHTAAPVPMGEEGHVAVSAPSMMQHYIDGEPAHRVDGLLLTGDVGHIDANGRLTLTDRIKPLIDVGGLKVSISEVEQVLTSHPAVHAAEVSELPVTDTARRVKAVVIPKPNTEVDSEQLRRFVRDRLSPHKVPRLIELRPAHSCRGVKAVEKETLRCW